MGIERPYVEALEEAREFKDTKPVFRCKWDGEISCPVFILEKDVYVYLPNKTNGKNWIAIRNASFIEVGRRVKALRDINRSCLERLKEEAYCIADLNLFTEAVIRTWKLKEKEKRDVR